MSGVNEKFASWNALICVFPAINDCSMSGCPDRKAILQLKTFEVKSAQLGYIQAVEKSFDANWAAHFHQLT